MSSDFGGVYSQQCEAPGARNPCVSEAILFIDLRQNL